MADDIDKLIKWAQKSGWHVEINSNGYRYFYAPDGTYVGYYPNTPSRPGRRWKRLLLDLKAHGLEWPPPSKSQLRARRRKEGN